ncbi:MAG: hypothetical protein AAF563_00720 [Pseudomonadota bacterium]
MENTAPQYVRDDIVAVQSDLDRIEAQLEFLRATLIELLGDDAEAVLRRNSQTEMPSVA